VAPFLGIHEAAAVTGDARYRHIENQLAEFLLRIQVRSEVRPELDGAWFRAFDYQRWEYFGSNADAGWGAWSGESGWTQGWIPTVLDLRRRKVSLWEGDPRPLCAGAGPQPRPDSGRSGRRGWQRLADGR